MDNLNESRSRKSFFDGIDDVEFLDTHFERTPIVLNREFDLLTDINPMFTLFEHAIQNNDVRFIDPQKGGSGYPADEIASTIGTKKLDAQAFQDLLLKTSYSFIIERFSHYSASAASIQSALADFLESRVLSICLVTPPHSRATNVHYDPVEAFVVQIYGSKEWTVFRPVTEMPAPGAAALTLNSIRKHNLEKYLTVELQPGDMLYIPRGWLHEVSNNSESISIHSTFLAYANTTYTFLKSMIDEILNEEHGAGQLHTRLFYRNINSDEQRLRLGELVERMQSKIVESIATKDISRYLTHVPNGKNQINGISAARETYRRLTNRIDESLLLRKNRIYYSAVLNAPEQIYEVVTDGENITRIDTEIWKKIEDIEIINLGDIRETLNMRDIEFRKLLNALVNDLGLFEIST